jgi:hypothetical protein
MIRVIRYFNAVPTTPTIAPPKRVLTTKSVMNALKLKIRKPAHTPPMTAVIMLIIGLFLNKIRARINVIPPYIKPLSMLKGNSGRGASSMIMKVISVVKNPLKKFKVKWVFMILFCFL